MEWIRDILPGQVLIAILGLMTTMLAMAIPLVWSIKRTSDANQRAEGERVGATNERIRVVEQAIIDHLAAGDRREDIRLRQEEVRDTRWDKLLGALTAKTDDTNDRLSRIEGKLLRSDPPR